MASFTNVLRTAAAVAPRIIRSPLRAPSIIRQQLAGEAIDALLDLLDTDDDGSGSGPQYSTMAPGPAGASYSTMNPGPGGSAAYTTMNPGPGGNAAYTMMNPRGGAGYGTMNPAPGAPYATMNRPPAYQNFTARPGVPPASPQQGGAQPMYPRVSPVGQAAMPPGMQLNIAQMPEVSVPAKQYQDDLDNKVKYQLDLNKYAVDIQKTMTRRGLPFDTETIKKYFINKGTRHVGMASLGWDQADMNARFPKLRDLWGYHGLIWVCAKNQSSADTVTFFSHCGKTDRFHHSSFKAGGAVVAAGEWIVERGRLKQISANSGHYRPSLPYFHRAVLLMYNAWQPDTTVLLYNTKTDTYEDVPVQQFVNNPSGGGVWKTHPKA